MKLLIIKSWNIFEYSEISDVTAQVIQPVIEAILSFKPYFINNEDGTRNFVGDNFPAKGHKIKYPYTKTIEEMYGHVQGFETFKSLIKNHYFDSISKVEILDITSEETLAERVFLVVQDEHGVDYTEITKDKVVLLCPVLEAIKNFQPYYTEQADGTKKYWKNNYPTIVTAYKRGGEKTAEQLYGHLEGFKILDKILHNPYFNKILSTKIIYTA